MSAADNKKISELAAATVLVGTEQIVVVQGGATVRTTVSALGTAGTPSDADFLVKTATASLTAERVVTDGTSITFNWGIAGQVTAERAALTGDVTASANSNTTTIANDAVTYAKMQNVSATSRVLGRKTSGSGDTEELTFSEVLDFVGSAAQGDILYRNATAWVRLGAGTSGQFLKTLGAGANPAWSNPTESIIVACSDEITALTAGTGKVTWRMPYAFTVTGIRGSLTTAQTSGSIFTVDINESGTTIISTKLTIDNTEKTTTTAATPLVISDASLADDAEMTVDIDQIGDGTAKGLKVTLIGYRT